MKKRFITALLLLTLSASAVACGNGEAESSEPSQSLEETVSTPEEESNVESEPDNQSEAESTPENESSEVSEKTLDDIESYLLDKGVLSGERVQMGAELIGAISGFKYKDSVGEIYEYDINSEEYQKLANGEEIPLQGMDGFTMKAISVNGKFALFGDDVPQELIDAFNSFE